MNEVYWLLDGKEFRTSCLETHRYVDALVEDAMRERSERGPDKIKHTFLDSLLDQTSDRIKFRSELINILLAGRDTTAGLLGWLFHVLVRHQEVYSKLRNIILEYFWHIRRPERHYSCETERMPVSPKLPEQKKQYGYSLQCPQIQGRRARIRRSHLEVDRIVRGKSSSEKISK